MVRARARARARVRVWARVRVMVRARARARVRVWARVMVRARARARARARGSSEAAVVLLQCDLLGVDEHRVIVQRQPSLHTALQPRIAPWTLPPEREVVVVGEDDRHRVWMG